MIPHITWQNDERSRMNDEPGGIVHRSSFIVHPFSLRMPAREKALRASSDLRRRLRQARRSAVARPHHSESDERSGCNTAWIESDPHLELPVADDFGPEPARRPAR